MLLKLLIMVFLCGLSANETKVTPKNAQDWLLEVLSDKIPSFLKKYGDSFLKILKVPSVG